MISKLPTFLINGLRLLLFLNIAACTSSPKTTDMPEAASYLSIMAERYGEEGECQMNEDNSFALCRSSFDIMASTPGIRFFTYDTSEGRVTYESDATCTSVEWIGNHHLEVLQSAGTVVQNAEQTKKGFIVDVRTGELSPLS